jgi:hypothetical protein
MTTQKINGQVSGRAMSDASFVGSPAWLAKISISNTSGGEVELGFRLPKMDTVVAELRKESALPIETRRLWTFDYQEELSKDGRFTNLYVVNAVVREGAAPSAPNPAPTPTPVASAPQAQANDQRSDIRRAVAFKGAIDAAPSLEDVRRSLAGITEDKERLTEASIFEMARLVNKLTNDFDLILANEFGSDSDV